MIAVGMSQKQVICSADLFLRQIRIRHLRLFLHQTRVNEKGKVLPFDKKAVPSVFRASSGDIELHMHSPFLLFS